MRELLALSVPLFVEESHVLGACGDGTFCWFTGENECYFNEEAHLGNTRSEWWLKTFQARAEITDQVLEWTWTHGSRGGHVVERVMFPETSFLLGIIVGLAMYHGVPVNLPLPPVIYKEIGKGATGQVSSCMRTSQSPVPSVLSSYLVPRRAPRLARSGSSAGGWASSTA